MLYSLFSVIALITVLYLFKRFTKNSLSQVRGPPSRSWIHGLWFEFLDAKAGELDFQWQAEYGDVIRLTAPFGETRLLISDPKAIQYMYHTSSYRFPKPSGRAGITRGFIGPGLVNLEGEDHKRARKVMLPGFGGPESRSYLPIFFSAASKVSQKWKDMIAADVNQAIEVNVTKWISRGTLDAIGEAAFDYQFGALDGSKNELTNSYTNLFVDTFGLVTKSASLGLAVIDRIPCGVATFIFKRLPIPRFSHGLKVKHLSEMVTKKLVETKTSALLEGAANRDIMSLLVKSNHSENPATRLTEEELYAQMNIIILAGHDTTANTMSFALLELCRNPQVQMKLREEIRSMKISGDLTSSDLDKMPYLAAVVKETLRFHPIVYNIFRIAGTDDVLPLSKPITTISGEVLDKLPIPKGTQLITSIAAYNRNKDIFGEDADVFNPERWMREKALKSDVSVGVYANLFTFAGGARACIGWRFALLEIQAFLVQLISTFEFEFTTSPSDIRREACFLMTPTLEGERAKGTQLPLRIRIARD